jgi:hypothetical protein
LASGTTTYSNTTFPTSFNATLFAYWDDLCAGPSYYGGTIYYWTTGNSPNRKFIVSWDSVYSLGGVGPFTFQIQLAETTGSVVFAYGTGSYPSSGYSQGIQGPSGQWEVPQSNSSSLTGRPPYDVRFDNFRVTFTGQALYNRYVVDQTGIGNSQEMNLPLAGMSVEARTDTGATVGSAITDANGNFMLAAVGVQPSVVGSIVVTSAGSACAVRKALNGPLYAVTLLSGVSFANDLNVGVLTLSDSNDPGGVNRQPINIVRAIQSVYAYATSKTAKAIPQVDPILFDVASSAPTSYAIKSGPTLASMRIGSAASGNPDAWDNSVIRKTYGRHVLGAIAADPASAFDSTFDKATDDQNAFAEGFGYYMNTIVSRDTKYFDGIDSSTTNIIDMENPAGLQTGKGSNVAAWCAAALYDLTDGVTANEPWDTFDGTGPGGDNAFLTAATLVAPATAGSFFTAWANRGYDATSLARNFIRHGLLADDADEPNDYFSESTNVAQFGFVRANRVLNQFNEDWYRFTMAYPTNVLTAEMIYDRTKYASASVLLELQTPSGAVLSTGVGVGLQGPITAKTGAIPAGDYIVRVRLLSGGPLPTYTLQAYSQLAFISGSFQPWTVGRPIGVPVNITGGIPPYDLTVLSPFVKPDGLILDGVNARVAGTPTGPQSVPIPPGGSYTYDFILSAQDSAAPTPNIASGPVSFTVNDSLKEHFEQFMAVPFGKPVDFPAPFTGGTSPFTASIDEGALPSGLAAVGGDDLRIAGTSDIPGSYAFTITGTDIAGSADTASVVGVSCVPMGQAAMAAGASACGFYFDVVKGSTVSITVTTAKSTTRTPAPRRALRATLIDSDGVTVLVKAKDRATKGRATSGKFVAPETGRYYFVVSSDDSGGAVTLQAKAKIVANKAGKGDSGPNSFVAPNTFPVEVGALGGAALTFTAKPSRGSGLQLRGAYLLDPSGNILLFAEGEVLERLDGSMTFRRILPISGTWTVVVGSKPGPQGTFTYVFSVKEPAGVVYSAD